MAILWTGGKGTSLKDIIRDLGNKTYREIECRILWKDREGNAQDDLFGFCSYDAGTGELTALDGDTYDLDDLYERWEETGNEEEGWRLVLWEAGELE